MQARKRLLPAALAAVALTACTPRELSQWSDWYRKDPEAAREFAQRPEVQASLRNNQPARRTTQPPASSSGVSAGNCDSYAGLFQKYGLPVSTFKAIAWRESGCNHRSFVMNSTDSGGGLLGINLKGRLAATWYDWCGATLGNITNAEVNVRCAGIAYRKMGMAPWR